MGLGKLIFGLIQIVGVAALAAGQKTSRDVSQLLRSNTYWISATYIYEQTPERRLIPIVQKKWRVDGNHLAEVTKNSVRVAHNGEKEWKSERINLNAQLSFDRIASFQIDDPLLTVYSRGSFQVSSPTTLILFRAADSQTSLLKPTRGRFTHMQAPVAFKISDLIATSFDPLPPTAHSQQTQLRHDLLKNRKVYVSEGFPRRYLQSVKDAVAEWNRGLKTNFYEVVDLESKQTPEECLLSEDLCLFWQGPENLAWGNYSGYSTITYDPAVGTILGGLILITNHHQSQVSHKVPPSLLQQLEAPGTGPALAGALWADGRYRNHQNPNPQNAITALLLHEMGHDHGFRHYFAGSLHPSQDLPSDTVMDYMPFPFFDRMIRLGSRDLEKIDALYYDGSFGSEFSLEMPCSDNDTLSNPTCNPQDLGEPAEYYTSILRAVGPFTQIQPTGGISGIFQGPEPAVRFASRFLYPSLHVTTFQKMKVKRTLCLHPATTRIQNYLSTLPSPYRLTCDEE